MFILFSVKSRLYSGQVHRRDSNPYSSPTGAAVPFSFDALPSGGGRFGLPSDGDDLTDLE